MVPSNRGSAGALALVLAAALLLAAAWLAFGSRADGNLGSIAEDGGDAEESGEPSEKGGISRGPRGPKGDEARALIDRVTPLAKYAVKFRYPGALGSSFPIEPRVKYCTRTCASPTKVGAIDGKGGNRRR